jgi:cytoplasmic tRNA 2-thiolation protein 2
MREFTAKEIAFYAVMKQCKYVTKSTLGTNSSIKSSIQRLTESFVNELQNDFPSTVYTIFNTGNKLKSCDEKDDKKCIICKVS